MVDPWQTWDERLKTTGQPRRVAEDLTDVELLNLLAVERAGNRHVEKEVIKQELFERLSGRP
jgi:hypothetical protein